MKAVELGSPPSDGSEHGSYVCYSAASDALTISSSLRA